jgi:hypothetical protein
MLTLLADIKYEYTNQLISILAPLIYQGILSIYNDACQIAQNKGEINTILKIFQSCLKGIIDWNQMTIENETKRIINSPYVVNKYSNVEHNYEWLNNLVKATLKSHITVLMYNPDNEKQNINPLFYQNIKLSHFIHCIYIECAVELWNNPYLLYHKYQPIELKRNQRDTLNIIKDCIKEAIRKLLPVKHILDFYLGENEIDLVNNDKFGKPLSEIEENYLTKMISHDLNNNNNNDNKVIITENVDVVVTIEEDDTIQNTNKSKKKMLSNIIDIINKPTTLSVNTAEKIQNKKLDVEHEKSDKILNEKINHIFNDLAVDTNDLVTSLSIQDSKPYSKYSKESIYQDIFSN